MRQCVVIRDVTFSADPRRRDVVHPLITLVNVTLCAVICWSDDFVSIAEQDRKKQRSLGRILDLSAGIPSHDRFNRPLERGLGAIHPGEFEK